MKVEIIPLNVNWAIIQLLPAGSLCVHQWMVWWIVDTGGWIKLNPSVSQSATEPAETQLQSTVLSSSELLISIHSVLSSIHPSDHSPFNLCNVPPLFRIIIPTDKAQIKSFRTRRSVSRKWYRNWAPQSSDKMYPNEITAWWWSALVNGQEQISELFVGRPQLYKYREEISGSSDLLLLASLAFFHILFLVSIICYGTGPYK